MRSGIGASCVYNIIFCNSISTETIQIKHKLSGVLRLFFVVSSYFVASQTVVFIGKTTKLQNYIPKRKPQ
jgi:hypothetical protein